MSNKIVHTVMTQEGPRYRVWSDNSDRYVSQILTEDELMLFSILMEIEPLLINHFYDPKYTGVVLGHWIQRGEVLKDWKVESEFIPADDKEQEKYSNMAKSQKEFLLKAANLWEEFFLNGNIK
ncbi:MAG TPA: hypothetical protein VK153_02135 [Candidatus Paceibacterota bacterium]|nr:hypothetical protein [Candidatus Paceibacterota bacterium]